MPQAMMDLASNPGPQEGLKIWMGGQVVLQKLLKDKVLLYSIEP